MEIKIDPEVLQKAIVAEITKTTFGEAIVNAVNKALTQKTGGYSSNTIIEAAAGEQVRKVVSLAISKELESKQEEIKALVQNCITDEVFKEMVSTSIGVMTGRLQLEKDY